MYFGAIASLLASFLACLPLAEAVPRNTLSTRGQPAPKIAPKVFLIGMFGPEGAAWYGIDEFDLLAQNITIPGLSPLYPDAHCTADGQICQIVTGESEINAATSVSALVMYPGFDLTKTYFMIAGIAGVNPEVATTGSVTFARYAVQVALQYEFDYRDLPDNFTTGYVAFGTDAPNEYPTTIYGTEVFEVNLALRDLAVGLASAAALNDTDDAKAYRAKYAPVAAYAAGAAPPSVVACDVATSDVYYSGDHLSQAFENVTNIWTNGSGLYCSTAEEDNGSLEVMVRAALAKLVDFSRIIVMRTCSDFDRPPPGVSEIQNLFYVDQGGFLPAIANIYLAGVKVVEAIVDGWDSTFATGITPTNYIGDIFNTLGGSPDFGQPDEFINPPSKMKRGEKKSVVELSNLRMKKKAVAEAKRAVLVEESL